MSTPRRTVGFNFLEEPELPGPQVTEAQAEQIVARALRDQRHARKLLGSNQDCNFVIYDASDDIVGVLKIANPAFNATELEAQDAAADLIAEAEPSLRIAVPLPNCRRREVHRDNGSARQDRLRPAAAVPAGRHSVRIGLPAPRRRRGPRRGGRPGQPRAGRVRPSRARPRLAMGPSLRRRRCDATGFTRPDPAQRAKAEEAAAVAWSRIAPLADRLPRQATHLDLTDANVVVTRGVGGDRPPRRRHRLRRPVAHLGGFGVGDHGVVGTRPLGQRSDLDPARSEGISRDPAVERRRGRGAVADAGAAHRGADRQRRTTGRRSTPTTPTSPSRPTARSGCSSRPRRSRST